MEKDESEERQSSPLLEFVSKILGIEGVKLTETDKELIFEIDKLPEGKSVLMPTIKTREDFRKLSDLLGGKELVEKIGVVPENAQHSFFRIKI